MVIINDQRRYSARTERFPRKVNLRTHAEALPILPVRPFVERLFKVVPTRAFRRTQREREKQERRICASLPFFRFPFFFLPSLPSAFALSLVEGFCKVVPAGAFRRAQSERRIGSGACGHSFLLSSSFLPSPLVPVRPELGRRAPRRKRARQTQHERRHIDTCVPTCAACVRKQIRLGSVLSDA
jgi:hypothetical protein